jgi:hypothetical protein
MTHKYIRRVPKGVTKTGKTKYMYFYAGQEGHGKGVAHESELVQGASFAFGEHGKSRYHAHITNVDGDKLTIKYDDGDKKGKEETMTKKQFQSLIHGEHSQAIKQAQSKAEKQLQEAKIGKEKGVKFSDKTMSKLEERVKNLQGLTQKQEQVKQEEKKKKTTPKKKEQASEDDIVKNVTKETIGKVLKSDLLNCTNRTAYDGSSQFNLTGINVNLERKQFEATDGRVLKMLYFPDDLKVNIEGKRKFQNGTCCLSPKLIKTLAENEGSTITFDTDTEMIHIFDKNNKHIDLDYSITNLAGKEYPDLVSMIQNQFDFPDYTKNTLTFSNSDKKLISSFSKLGYDTSTPLSLICDQNGKTYVEVEGFSLLPDSFQNTLIKRVDNKKLWNAIHDQEGIQLDSTYKKKWNLDVIRNRKTKEVIGVCAIYQKRGNGTAFDDILTIGLPNDIINLIHAEENDNLKQPSDGLSVIIPTNIKSNVDSDKTKKYRIDQFVNIVNSVDKLTVPDENISMFTNNQNVQGLIMPIIR